MIFFLPALSIHTITVFEKESIHFEMKFFWGAGGALSDASSLIWLYPTGKSNPAICYHHQNLDSTQYSTVQQQHEFYAIRILTRFFQCLIGPHYSSYSLRIQLNHYHIWLHCFDCSAHKIGRFLRNMSCTNHDNLKDSIAVMLVHPTTVRVVKLFQRSSGVMRKVYSSDAVVRSLFATYLMVVCCPAENCDTVRALR